MVGKGLIAFESLSEPRITTPRPYDCRRSLYGCCNDRYTPKRDQWGSNCRGKDIAESATKNLQQMTFSILSFSKNHVRLYFYM